MTCENNENVILKISNDEFYDDAQLLVRSFFVDAIILREKKNTSKDNSFYINADVFLPDNKMIFETRGEQHDYFKRGLYSYLVKITGKTLPWGFLTGVRPAKRAMEMIKNASSDISKADVIRAFEKKYMTSETKATLAYCVAQNERRILANKNISDMPNGYNGFSVYIGIPFCPTTCLYCSFPSAPINSCTKETVNDYINALMTEIRISRDIYFSHLENMGLNAVDLKPSSVYVGGGTPTSLTPKQLDVILKCLKDCFVINADTEFCVEAGRPDSITFEKLSVLKENGANRISVNPQTMNQKTLDILGRMHSTEDVFKAFEMVRSFGFNNINTDIIIGLPDEGEEEIANTINAVKALMPDSLTVHSLALKRASRLKIKADDYSSMIRRNSEKIMDMTFQLARELDMMPYYMYRQQNMTGNFENTGYAKRGKESVYNIVIMEELQDILAMGAGASSKFMMGNNRFERALNVKDIRNYTDRLYEMCDRKKDLLAKF